MRQSKLFTKTRKEAPKDEVARNAELLIRGGFIHKEMAGVYSLLPLGFRVLKRIEAIIREEMNALGGQEVLLTTLQDPALWKKSGRWVEETDEEGGLPWFKTELAAGGELGIANTHEEALVNTLLQHVSSYKDLPLYVYQIQNKFRNELRAKSGILRGREFLMKDLYSFSKTEEEFREFYEACAAAYMKIFERVGVGHLTYRTFASGGAFSKYSDEFQTLCDAGEDTIYLDKKKGIAVNKEVYTDEVLEELELDKQNLLEVKAIEVGNIFPLGTKYAEVLDLSYTDEDGNQQTPVMGSYGIGLGRLLGTVVEVLSDEDGIVWPESIAPFTVHLVVITPEEGKGVHTEAEKLYTHLTDTGVDVLYDDRDASAGEKLTDADLIGIPLRVVVSKKTVAQKKLEVRERATGEVVYMNQKELLEHASSV